MSKTPPGVKRMVSVLNFFAEHPGQAFTFTDIVKALKLGRATCHALLAGLVEEQYLYRNADKSYVIGPALAAIGKIANEQFSPLQAANPEMRVLSDECDSICSAVYLDGKDVVIVARAGSGSHLGWTVPQGYRLPLAVPFAAAFFAWSKAEELEKWLSLLTPQPDPKRVDALRASIEFTRNHGFAFGITNENVASDLVSPEVAFQGDRTEYPIISLSELHPDEEYQVGFINTPVIGKEGEVVFVLNLSGFAKPISGKQVEQFGTLLREAAERLTAFVTGNKNSYPFKSRRVA